jgi:KaiC/GvpD/RAD55 family RecA-like ATPase
VIEALRSNRGIQELAKLLEAEGAINDLISALGDAALVARAKDGEPSNPDTASLSALIPSWRQIQELAEASVRSLKALGLREPPPTFQDIAHAPCVPLSNLTHLIDQETLYTIYPICPRGALTMIQGMPKGGKSTFSLWLALCAAIGHWPSGIFRIDRPLKVLFVEFEDRPILVVKRASRYLAGAGFDPRILPTDLHLCDSPTLWLDSAKYEKAMIEHVRAEKYDLVIIDTLSYVHQAESENDAADMKVLTSALKRIVSATDCSLVFLHHTGKGSKEKAVSEAARGSSVIPACADVILHWGDRGDSDITPVSVTSKYDDGFRCSVEYIRKEEGAVEWRITDSGASKSAPRGRQGVEAVFAAVVQVAAQEQGGVRQSSVVAMMSDQSMPKPTVLRHLGELVASRRLAKRIENRAVLYTLVDV